MPPASIRTQEAVLEDPFVLLCDHKIGALRDLLADQAYWETKIRPMVADNSDVEFIGEIGERDKADFLGGAAALLFPIDWPEPFGLVMIEAMACGTP